MAKKYSAEIKSLKRCIKDMEQIKEILWNIEETASGIEKELCDLDASLPTREEMELVRDPSERQQLQTALELLERSFSLVDEILGPAQDEFTGEPSGTAFSPEARGNGKEISLDDLLKLTKTQSKYNAS